MSKIRDIGELLNQILTRVAELHEDMKDKTDELMPMWNNFGSAFDL